MGRLELERWERWFLYGATAVLALFFLAILASIGQAGIHLPSEAGTVDPARVAETPPFDAPGVREVAPGRFEAVVVARTWRFETGETDADGLPVVTVPAGAEVTFVATSVDVIHGLFIPGTTVNAMVIPGRITRITQRFDEPGEYLLVCHEFCGLANAEVGHQSMYGKVVVEG